MTVFDIIVLLIVGVAAIGGFLRGLVQEVASLAAWVLAIFAVRYLHTDLTAWLNVHLAQNLTAAALLAFTLLLMIPYAGAKLLARQITSLTDHSVLNPVDRVLGFCFGALKGAIVVVFAYALLVIGFESNWQAGGKPAWVVGARSYQLVNAGADNLVEMIHARRVMLYDGKSASGKGE